MGFYQSPATSWSAALCGRPYSKLSLLLSGWRQREQSGAWSQMIFYWFHLHPAQGFLCSSRCLISGYQGYLAVKAAWRSLFSWPDPSSWVVSFFPSIFILSQDLLGLRRAQLSGALHSALCQAAGDKWEFKFKGNQLTSSALTLAVTQDASPCWGQMLWETPPLIWRMHAEQVPHQIAGLGTHDMAAGHSCIFISLLQLHACLHLPPGTSWSSIYDASTEKSSNNLLRGQTRN